MEFMPLIRFTFSRQSLVSSDEAPLLGFVLSAASYVTL